MHQDRTNHYLGAAGETISVDATVPNSGTLQISFSGAILATLPPTQTVNFSQNAGDRRDLIATLTGPTGSHCAISIFDVDGGKDVTSLLIGAGAFHDNVVLEFVTVSDAVNAFVAEARTPAKKGPRK